MTVYKKIMLLGEIGVGKTSLARRLSFEVFDENYKATIGTDIYLYEVVPSPCADPFSFIVWDTDGTYGEAIFRHVYVKEAHAAMIVGDVTRRQTLETMANLGEMFVDAMPGRFCGFVLNKLDLISAATEPAIPPRLARLTAQLSRTSAKTGDGVAEAFHRAARTIVRRGL